jgi:uncharacterized membrane protein
MIRYFFFSLPLLLLGDFLWLGYVVKDFNLRQLAAIGRIENGSFQILPVPAVIAYLLMALSIALFSAPRASEAGGGVAGALWGAALGLVIYGIFDCTNLAVLKNYPVTFALVDIAWGTFLYGAVTWAVVQIGRV